MLARACCLAVMLIALPASAYVRETTADGLHYLRWDSSSFPIAWSLQSDAPGSMMNAQTVADQFAQWPKSSCAKLAVSSSPAMIPGAQAVAAQDGKNEVFWQNNWKYGSAVLGLTTPWYDVSTGIVQEADIQFNNQDWSWHPNGDYETCVQSQSGCADTGSIALHEEGHFLGLAHSKDTSAVMFATWDGTPKRTLTMDDIQGICAIYPAPMSGAGVQDEPCSAAADCTAGLKCESVAGTTSTVCSTTCTSETDASCSLGDSCQAAAGGGFGCFPAPSGGVQGKACSQSMPCAYGYDCLSFSTSSADGGMEALCFQDCNPTAPACANNLKCNPWGTITPPANSQGGYCDGMGPPPGASECAPCNDGNPCRAGLDCVPLNDGSGNAICRTPCSQGTQCDQTSLCLPTSDFAGTGGVCACTSDTGLEGGPCQNDGSCNAGLACVNDGSASESLCRTECGGSLPPCKPGYSCNTLSGTSVCLFGPPIMMPDAGVPGDDAGTTSSGGGASSSGCASTQPGIWAVIAGIALVLRRRSTPGSARRR